CQGQIVPTSSVTVGTLAMGAARGVVVPAIVKVEERRQRGGGLEPDAATVTPVAAVGTSIADELLAAGADAAGHTGASLDEDSDLVDEHAVHRGPWRARRRSHRVGGDAHEARV